MSKIFFIATVTLIALTSISIFGASTLASMDHGTPGDCFLMHSGECVPTNNILGFIGHHIESIQLLGLAVFDLDINLMALLLILSVLVAWKFQIISLNINLLLREIREFKEIFFVARRQFFRWLIFHNKQNPNNIMAYDIA